MRRGLLLVVVAAVAAFAYGAGGTGKPDDVPPARSAAAAPPTACVNGSGDLGDTYYPGIGNGGYDVTHYDLNLGYNPTTHILNGKATITAAATQNLCRFNLDLRRLDVDSVKVDGAAATFTRDGRELMITPATPLVASARLHRRGRLPRRAGPGPASTRTASSTAGTTPRTGPTPRRRRRAPTPGTRATTTPTTRRPLRSM